MTGKFLISAMVAAGFWRCGRYFTPDGVLVDAVEFTEEQWDRLKAEVKLRIEEAGASATTDREALKVRIDEAIQSFGADDFGSDGKPKLGALRELLTEDAKAITAKLRDTIFEEMVEGGFEAPVAAP